MNPLTQVKRIQSINAKEASLGLSEEASWHAKYADSAYVYVGGIPFDLTEGDLLAVFAQCGELVDVNLVRDKATGKSKGFAFLAYEDQRSTVLAVDNLNGAQILGRIIRVDHVTKYKKREEEDEETLRKKREERGVCRAFQRGECSRGDSCKFSHDEQRAANTGWGDRDKEPRWGHDRFDGPKKGERRPGNIPTGRGSERTSQEGDRDSHSRVRNNETLEREPRQSNRREDNRLGSQADGHGARESDCDAREKSPRRRSSYDYLPKSSEGRDKLEERRSRKHDDDEDGIIPKSREGLERKERSRRHREDDDAELKTRQNLDRREEKRSRNEDYEFEQKPREVHDRGEGRKLKRYDDNESVLKSRGYEDKKGGERSKRYVHVDVEPMTRDRKEDKRSSGHDNDRFESRSREANGRNDERKSRMYKG